MNVMGLDIGGSGIKGAIVNTKDGSFLSERLRLDTPEGADPTAVAKTVSQIIGKLKWKGVIGVGFPSVIQNGVAISAANISSEWIGLNVNALLGAVTQSPVFTINDADAAGIAEMKFGVGKNFQKGIDILLTLGTGIGSAIFIDGRLLPNTELGHLLIRGKDAEKRASDGTRKNKELSWKKWSKRLQEYLNYLEALFSPDVFIIGGGVSKQADQFLPLLHTRAKMIPASMLNQAGIVGAAMNAEIQSTKK